MSTPSEKGGPASEHRSGAPARSTRRGRATRERILATVAEMIWAHGDATLTLADIQAEARVSKSQIYDYFEDKQALILASLTRESERMLTIEEARLRAVHDRATLQTWRDTIVDCFTSAGPRSTFAALTVICDTGDDALQALLLSGLDRWQRAVVGALGCVSSSDVPLGDQPSTVPPSAPRPSLRKEHHDLDAASPHPS